MWLWMVVGLALLWVLVTYLVGRIVGLRRSGHGRAAVQALDRQLAAGEITAEEYRHARQLRATGH